MPPKTRAIVAGRDKTLGLGDGTASGAVFCRQIAPVRKAVLGFPPRTEAEGTWIPLPLKGRNDGRVLAAPFSQIEVAGINSPASS
jgi:hypothetical protein